MIELTNAERLVIAQVELKKWMAEAYTLELRARGYKLTENQRGLDQTSEGMTSTLAIMDVLKEEIELLEGKTEG